MKVRKVFKYATGEEIPEGAIYLKTIKNGLMEYQGILREKEQLYFVWHYFLVEVEDK